MIYNAEKLRKDIIIKRVIDNNTKTEVACVEIRISKATLSRLEHGGLPDIETFAKVCTWLDNSPEKYFTKTL